MQKSILYQLLPLISIVLATSQVLSAQNMEKILQSDTTKFNYGGTDLLDIDLPSKQGFAFVFEEAWEAKLNVYKIEPSGLELFPNDLQLCNSISNLCGDKSRPFIINAAGYEYN